MEDGHDREVVPATAREAFDRLLLELLRATPAGLSEYDLFAALCRRGDSRFDISRLRDSFSLFCSHFRLFNALYRLREELWRSQQGELEINPLRVILRPYRARESSKRQLAEHDGLRDYYLDITHLEQTTAAQVEQMLDKFWLRLAGSERRREALAVLGLSDPVAETAIKQHYRKLVMKHHPDRGGDTVRLQMINAAMAVLEE